MRRSRIRAQAGRPARLPHATWLAARQLWPDDAAEPAAWAGTLPRTLAARARLSQVRDMLHPRSPDDPVQVRALADLAAEMIGAGEIHPAFRLLLAVAVRVWSGDSGPQTRPFLIVATELLQVMADDPRLLSTAGAADPGWAEDPPSLPDWLDPVPPELTTAAHLVGAGEAITAVQRAVVDVARREGRIDTLPRLLTQQTWHAIAQGDWQAAVPAADEAVRLAARTGQPVWQAAAMTGQAMIASMRGDHEVAEQLVRRAETTMLPARAGEVLCGIQFVRGVTAIGVGRYDQAFDHLRRLFDSGDPSHQVVQSTWALGDLAEAATRTGRKQDAREIMAAFGPGERDCVTPWTRVALLYAAPLLADDEEAEKEFQRALEADLVRWPFYRARLLLAYGSWLRRRRRIAEARAPLRTARELCEAHELRPWTERAAGELRATGEASQAPRERERVPLSPQELQIAQLAAEGLSNREIGQRLYLSHRTIGSHLYRILPKVGISSRSQLRFVLTDGDAG